MRKQDEVKIQELLDDGTNRYINEINEWIKSLGLEPKEYDIISYDLPTELGEAVKERWEIYSKDDKERKKVLGAKEFVLRLNVTVK